MYVGCCGSFLVHDVPFINIHYTLAFIRTTARVLLREFLTAFRSVCALVRSEPDGL